MTGNEEEVTEMSCSLEERCCFTTCNGHEMNGHEEHRRETSTLRNRDSGVEVRSTKSVRNQTEKSISTDMKGL